MSRCKHCDSTFFWGKIGQQWIPYDDSAKTIPHRCMPGLRASEERRAEAQQAPPANAMEERLQKIEAMIEEVLSILKGDLR